MRAHIASGLRLRRYRDTPVGYLCAAAILLGALAVRAALDHWVTIPFATLFPAMILAGLVGGRVAGIAVMLVGGLIAAYLWVWPQGTTQIGWTIACFNVGLYLVTASAILYAVHALNGALDEIERERDRSASLFQELQHRTANNLQSVAALIRYSMKRVQKDPAAAEQILDNAYNRFETMSRIHRRLYRADRVTYAVQPELNELCQEVLNALGARRIALVVTAEKLELDQERMLAVSLLVVELVINTVKHAFSHDQSGTISIALERADTQYRLVYRDDGSGLPAGFDFLTSESLGSRIVQGFVVQLGGTLRCEDGAPGARFVVTFPTTAARPDMPATANDLRIVAAQ